MGGLLGDARDWTKVGITVQHSFGAIRTEVQVAQ
jgi:hypothetical protein